MGEYGNGASNTRRRRENPTRHAANDHGIMSVSAYEDLQLCKLCPVCMLEILHLQLEQNVHTILRAAHWCYNLHPLHREFWSPPWNDERCLIESLELVCEEPAKGMSIQDFE